MVNPRIAFLIQSLVFFIPVNVYVINDWLGAGIQWALVRFQVSFLGESLISFTNELGYVSAGMIHGRSEWALLLWALAIILLIGCFVINLFFLQRRLFRHIRLTFLVTVICGILFVISDIVQYGVTFHNNAGFCIPIGFPIICLIGLWGYRNLSVDDSFEIGDRENTCHENTVFSGINLPGIPRTIFMNDIIFLIIVSVVVKTVIFFISLYAPFDVITGDVELYYHYAGLFAAGNIPYVSFPVEYPPFFFIPALVAFFPAYLLPSFSTYLFSYIALMFLVDAATLVCVYLLAFRFFGQTKAFVSGLLYVTAIAAAFFIPITYDLVPTFLLLLSLLLYCYGKEVSAYTVAGIGTLTKWFPVLAMPFFFLHALKSKREHLGAMVKGILIAIFLFVVCTVPFLFLNRQVFQVSYVYYMTRAVQSHSLVYYADTLFRFVFQKEFFGPMSLVLLAIIEIGLLYYYYRFSDTRMITLGYFIFFSVFFFIVLNKIFSASYIIWLTPFLAIFLTHTYRHIIMFYAIEMITYIETPLLYRIVYGGKPYDILENSLPSFSFLFYTVKFLIFFIVLWIIIRDYKILKNQDA